MSGTTRRAHYQRARTDSEKSERRRTILGAAEAHLRAAGFQGFSMAVLAKKAGIAKGTLYLYFETREEVLLALYAARLTAWSSTLTAAIQKRLSDEDFVRCFLETSRADPIFLELSSRLGSVIEQNVSIERLVESKRLMRGIIVPLAEQVERCLGLEPGTGSQAGRALLALLLGASQLDAGPSLQSPEIPADVREQIELSSGDDVFLANAPLILAGIRARGALIRPPSAARPQ